MVVEQKAERCLAGQRWGQSRSRMLETVGKARGTTDWSGKELRGSSGQGLLEAKEQPD